MEIRSGVGGSEAASFAMELFRMYENFVRYKGGRFEITNIVPCTEDGYREASAFITGKSLFGALRNVDEDGSITCPKCRESTPLQAGLSSMLSLPDSYAKAEGSGTGKKSIVSCDECMDVEVAVSRCATCSSHLCSFHTEGHKRSRATHGHEVLSLDDVVTETAATASSATQSQHRCALHPSSPLTKFCTKFREWCTSCAESTKVGYHGSSSHQHRGHPHPTRTHRARYCHRCQGFEI
ncbi:peptide chain release factor 1-like isoform X1 [Sycon ciliatum]|uniref:peptide chain release factor 1-like isoform X1 n=1 Tax=Sycon ciliatum TaxID=27933 RepID=UPI0031F64329